MFGITKHKTVIGGVLSAASIFAPGVAESVSPYVNEIAGGYLSLGLVHKMWKFLRPGGD